jgi:hypothetical protein
MVDSGGLLSLESPCRYSFSNFFGLPCSVFHALKLVALKMVLGDQSGECVVYTTIMDMHMW